MVNFLEFLKNITIKYILIFNVNSIKKIITTLYKSVLLRKTVKKYNFD